MKTIPRRQYRFYVRFLDGHKNIYTVSMTAKKRYAHESALHKMKGVLSVEILRIT